MNVMSQEDTLRKKMSVKFKMHLLRTDVTALKYAENLILAGIGGCIKIFDPLKSTLLVNKEIFYGEKIHGIEGGPDNNVLVWGGKMISHFKLNLNDSVQISEPLQHWLHDDWILHAKWLEEDYVAVVTAHNQVSIWNWRTEKKLKTVTCEEKCIVYCALLVGTLCSDLVVLAGTVFQEVVIWSLQNHQSLVNQPVLHRLIGHKGVIFSIFYDASSRQLSTTSDDRSVRVWSVSGGWPHARVSLLRTLYGHRARVWRSAVAGPVLLSAGEDAQLCVWGDGERLLRRWGMHQGASVWSLDFSRQHGLIVTGGGDGGVSLWPLHSWCEVSLTPTPLPLHLASVPRLVAMASAQLLAAVTDSGSILYRQSERWETACHDDRLASYCLMELSPCREFIAFCSISGHVLMYRIDSKLKECPLSHVLDIKVIDSKIFSLQWLGSDCVLISGSHGIIEIWRLIKVSQLNYNMEKVYTFQLPAGKEQWVCAAVLCGESLVCGDRSGSILRYELVNESEPVQTFHRLHGRLGVCSLRADAQWIVSTGRDGTMRWFDRRREALELESTDKLPMSWAMATLESSYGLLVLGFSEVNLMVWSHREQRTLLEVSCGGGHRSWDALLDSQNVLHFVHVRERAVHAISCPLERLVKPVLQPGFHSKEVGCVRLFPSSPDAHPILVSSSEDTTIRLSSLGPPDQLTCLATLRGHVSSVRALAVCPDRSLLFSGGGRAQLKVWRVSTEAAAHGVACREAARHTLREDVRRPWRLAAAQPAVDPETRYMDLCVMRHAQDEVSLVAGCSDGLLRLFTYTPSTETLHLAMACSHHNRCILKVCHVTLQSGADVVLSMATDGQCALWAMPRHWAMCGDDVQPFATIKLHQSGVNSCDRVRLGPDTFLLATGGDDNCMAVTVLRITVEPALGVETVAQTRIASSHSAQITGLAFIDSHLVSACIDQRLRVWRWEYVSSGSILSCSLVGEYCTTVSDIQGLQLWRHRNRIFVCVHGKGMEVIDVDIGT